MGLPKKRTIRRRRVKRNAAFSYEIAALMDALAATSDEQIDYLRASIQALAASDEIWERVKVIRSREADRKEDMQELRDVIDRLRQDRTQARKARRAR